MSAVPMPLGRSALAWPTLAVVAGFAAMFVPVYWWAAHGIWQEDEHAHGALILAVSVWLFWERRRAWQQAQGRSQSFLGWSVFCLGLLMYVLGRALDFSILTFAAQVPVVLGAVLLLKGFAGARALWFPILYLVFMAPLPGVLVDAATGALKQWVSVIAEHLLYMAGYPIGRSGVMLTIGQYQLLVADACSGLHSMFSLTALGVLFMYLMARASKLHNTLMLLSILPIAFAANIVRVIVLVLITYHFGDEAGQGFLHGAAGMVLLLGALAILFGMDALLLKLLPARKPVEVAP